MPDVNYTQQGAAYRDQIEQYIRQYCQQNDLNPDNYIGFLDGKTAFDASILRDPALEEYLAHAHASLLSIIDPVAFQSLYAQIEAGELTFDDIERIVDPELVDFINSFLLDSPETAALFSGQNPAEVLAYFQNINFTGSAVDDPYDFISQFREDYVNQAARDTVEKRGWGDEWMDMITYEENMTNLQNHYMAELLEIDQFMMEIHEAVLSGKLSDDEGKIQKEQMLSRKDTLLINLSDVQNSMTQMLEFFSIILKNIQDTMDNIVANGFKA